MPAAVLSGGERNRLHLAKLLKSGGNLLLLDEPLSNLDAKLRVQMRSEIARIQHDEMQSWCNDPDETPEELRTALRASSEPMAACVDD